MARMKNKITGLTDKQEAFVQGLIAGKSQREAYKAAYKCGNMSDTVIDVKASELAADGNVAVRYEFLHKKVLDKAEADCIVTGEMVIAELAKIAFANATDFASIESDAESDVVRFVPTDELSADKRAALAEIGQTRDGVKIKQHDKVRALELLGRHFELFTDKSKTEMSGGVEITLGDNVKEFAE